MAGGLGALTERNTANCPLGNTSSCTQRSHSKCDMGANARAEWPDRAWRPIRRGQATGRTSRPNSALTRAYQASSSRAPHAAPMVATTGFSPWSHGSSSLLEPGDCAAAWLYRQRREPDLLPRQGTDPTQPRRSARRSKTDCPRRPAPRSGCRATHVSTVERIAMLLARCETCSWHD